MLSVVFFASVKEQLNCAGLQLDWDDSLASFKGLEDHMFTLKGDNWRGVLSEDNIVRAVNHAVVDSYAQLRDGDEVAYFPPVTGG